MRFTELEQLKDVLKDDKLTLLIGSIKKLIIAPDRSVLRVRVEVFPERIEMIARMTWDLVGEEGGIFQFPSLNDLVVLGFIDGNEDEAFVLKRLTSKEDKIPLKAVQGHLVVRAKPGTKTFLTSDTKINITRPDNEGDEKLVLGNTFKDAYSTQLQLDATHRHIGNLGYYTSVPDVAQDYLDIKASPVDDELMLSDISYTEK